MKLLEHGPKEILYALKQQDPEIVYMYDLENSKFNEIDPATAANIIKTKSGPENVLLFIDGKLVRFDSNGKVASTFNVSSDKKYVTKSGKVVTSTGKIPVSHLIKVADKIYRADFVPKQRNSITRNNNIYASTYGWPGKNSRGLKQEYHDVLYDLQNDPRKTVHNTPVAKAVKQFYHKQQQLYAQKVEQAEQAVEEYENLLKANEGNPAKQSDIRWKIDSVKYDLQSFTKELDKIRQAIITTTNAGYDIEAAYRNIASADNLQGKLVGEIKKLQEVQRLRNKIQRAAEAIDKIRREGSDKTISLRKDLEDVKRQLAYVEDKLDGLKANLDAARAADEEAIKKAMAEYDKIEQQAKDARKLTRIQSKR